MSQNKLSLWVHFVWSTKQRQPYITPFLKHKLLNKFEEIATTKNYDIVEMNLMPDHVHLLIRLNPIHNVSTIMKNLKGITSHWINENKLTDGVFEWQDGYGAFSVSSFMVSKVVNYIRNQEEHHADKDFGTEMKYLEILGNDI